jgi:hypothetical protein
MKDDERRNFIHFIKLSLVQLLILSGRNLRKLPRIFGARFAAKVRTRLRN